MSQLQLKLLVARDDVPVVRFCLQQRRRQALSLLFLHNACFLVGIFQLPRLLQLLPEQAELLPQSAAARVTVMRIAHCTGRARTPVVGVSVAQGALCRCEIVFELCSSRHATQERRGKKWQNERWWSSEKLRCVRHTCCNLPAIVCA
jgi:hypothetical protein